MVSGAGAFAVAKTSKTPVSTHRPNPDKHNLTRVTTSTRRTPQPVRAVGAVGKMLVQHSNPTPWDRELRVSIAVTLNHHHRSTENIHMELIDPFEKRSLELDNIQKRKTV